MQLEFFGDSSELLEIAVRAIIMYVFTVAMIRFFGKRTTMTTAGFDLILTVALGSILASTIMSTTRPIFHGMLALAALAGLQWLLSFSVSRNDIIQRIVVSPAKILLEDGRIISSNLRAERLSLAQLEQKIRQQGFAHTNGLKAVILESSGNVSVIDQSEGEAELVDREDFQSRAL